MMLNHIFVSCNADDSTIAVYPSSSNIFLAGATVEFRSITHLSSENIRENDGYHHKVCTIDESSYYVF